MPYLLIALVIVNIALAGLGFAPWRDRQDSLTQREIQAEALLVQGPSRLIPQQSEDLGTESIQTLADHSEERSGATTAPPVAATDALPASAPSPSPEPTGAQSSSADPTASSLTSAPSEGTPAPPVAQTAPMAFCAEWGPFGREQFQEAASWIEGQFAQAEIFSRLISSPAGWMVYVPPAASMQQSTQRAAALRSSGITELFVVQEEGPLRGAISLGVFRSEEAAQRLLAQRRAQGVGDARMMAREAIERVWMRLNDTVVVDWVREQTEQGMNLPESVSGNLEWRDC